MQTYILDVFIETPPDCSSHTRRGCTDFQENSLSFQKLLSLPLTTAHYVETKIDKWMHELYKAGLGQRVAVAKAISSSVYSSCSLLCYMWGVCSRNYISSQSLTHYSLICFISASVTDETIFWYPTCTRKNLLGVWMDGPSDINACNNIQASILGSFCCIGKKSLNVKTLCCCKAPLSTRFIIYPPYPPPFLRLWGASYWSKY